MNKKEIQRYIERLHICVKEGQACLKRIAELLSELYDRLGSYNDYAADALEYHAFGPLPSEYAQLIRRYVMWTEELTVFSELDKTCVRIEVNSFDQVRVVGENPDSYFRYYADTFLGNDLLHYLNKLSEVTQPSFAAYPFIGNTIDAIVEQLAKLQTCRQNCIDACRQLSNC